MARCSKFAGRCALIVAAPLLMSPGQALFPAMTTTCEANGTCYVTPGGAGLMNGVDWNNAYAGLPGSPACGVTYYIAGGVYDYSSTTTAWTINCTSATPIVVQKAVSDGSGNPQNVAGWQASYGTSKAVFSQTANPDPEVNAPEFFTITGTNGYLTIDGITPTSGTPTTLGPYGIVLRSQNNVQAAWMDVSAPNVTIRHVEFDGARPDYYGVDIASCSTTGGTETVNLASSITGTWVEGDKVDVYADALGSSGSNTSPRDVPIHIVTGTQITVSNTYTGTATCVLTSKSYVALAFSTGTALVTRSPASNVVFADNYVHELASPILSSSCTSCSFKRNYFARDHSTPNWHTNIFQGPALNNSTIAQNIVEDPTGTGTVTPTCGGSSCNWDGDAIYSNLIFCTQAADANLASSTASPQCNAIEISDDEGANSVTNTVVYGNTLVWRGSTSVALCKIHFLSTSSTGNLIENNLYYCPNTAALSVYAGVGGTVSYNTVFGSQNNNLVPETGSNYYMCPPTSSNCTDKVAFVDPFVDSSDSGKDFHLSSETVDPHLNAGVALAPPYNVDLVGITRGADGTWERGVYEFNTGTIVQTPGPPLGLRVTSIQ
jgi:hypothetical protein